MIQLRTLGRLDLAGSPGEATGLVIGQPKRAALLVYLTLAHPRGYHRRDSLIAMFWPEMDTVRARQSLRQVVYMLRQVLGREAVLSRGDEELAVNPGRLGCDAIAFEEGIVSGRAETVLESYAGDFLTGFFASGAAPEFDEWVATERQRLRALAANGAWAVAMQEERAHNTAGAAHWARRAVSFTPDDEEATRDLMILLARVGDRSGALRAYDHLTSRLLADFEAKPSPELHQLAQEMRTEASRFTPPMHPPPPSPRVSPAGHQGVDRRASSSVPSTSRSRPWGWAVLVLLVTVGTWVAVSRLSSPRRTPVFAVGEINDHTRTDSTQLASAFANLLATSIARLPSLDVVGSPRLHEIRSQGRAVSSGYSTADAAKSAGAGRLVEGDLRLAGGRLVLDLRIVDLASGRILHVLRALGSDPFDLADRAASSLAIALEVAPPSQPLSEITTGSLVALRLYEQGLGAYYAADPSAARRLFSAALEEDSTFSMAAFYLAKVSIFPESLVVLADRLASRATDHDRLLIRGTIGQWRMLPAASAYAETLAVRYPSDVDGQLLLGQTRAITGDFAGAVDVLHGVIRTDSQSINLEGVLCRACEAYISLVDAYRNWDSLAAAARSARDWIRRSPGSSHAWRLLWTALEGVGTTEEYLQSSRVMDSLNGRPWNRAFYDVGMALQDGRYGRAEAELRRMLAADDGRFAVEYTWFLVIALWQQGRLRESLELTTRPSTDPASLLLLQAQTLFLAGRHRDAAGMFDQIAGALGPERDGHAAKHATWNRTHAATAFAAAGDTARLAVLAGLIERSGARSIFGRDPRLHHYVRGLLARARNDLESSEREFRQAVLSWNLGYTRINYELSRVLLETGRAAEAVRVLQAAFRGSIEANNLYITRTELHEVLARAWDQAGNRDSARAHWRAVVEAWRGADPQFQPRWQAAVVALARR